MWKELSKKDFEKHLEAVRNTSDPRRALDICFGEKIKRYDRLYLRDLNPFPRAIEQLFYSYYLIT